MMVRTRKEITKGEITGKASRMLRQIFDDKENKKNKGCCGQEVAEDGNCC